MQYDIFESVFRKAVLQTCAGSTRTLHFSVTYTVICPVGMKWKRQVQDVQTRSLKTLAIRATSGGGERASYVRASAGGGGARAAARDVSSGAPLPRLARVVRADHLRLRHAAALLLRKREPVCHTRRTRRYRQVNTLAVETS